MSDVTHSTTKKFKRETFTYAYGTIDDDECDYRQHTVDKNILL